MSNLLDFTLLLRSDYKQWLITGLATTLELTLVAWLIAIALGILLTLIRLSNGQWRRTVVAAYVEYHQNVPMLVQIFLWYFGLPALLPHGAQEWANNHNSEFIFSSIAVGLCMAAYVSEDLRGGIRAIPGSQFEASRALGLNYVQAFRLVILPQAIRIALPTLINHTVLLFKSTSLALTVGVAELTYATREIESESFRTVEVYVFTTAVYLTISLALMFAGTALERSYRTRAA